MSARELTRAGILARVAAGTLRLGSAAMLMAVSYRQAKRLYRRFARPPASSENFHVMIPRGLRLDAVFRLEDTRTVSNDWVVRYDNRYFQLARQSHRPPARATVQVYEACDGQIEIRYRDRAMRYAELSADALTATRAEAPAAYRPGPATSPAAHPPPGPRRRRGHQGADHPWHHSVTQRCEYLQFARDRRAWERVQP